MDRMNRSRARLLVGIVLAPAAALAALAVACDKPKDGAAASGAPTASSSSTSPPSSSGAVPSAKPATRPLDPAQLVAFAPLPAKIERPDNVLTDEKVALGRMLYFDARLSRGQDVSCNTCHDVTRSGADDQAVSVGTKKQKGTRNAPTIFNAAGGYAQGWDARASLVEELVVPHAAEPAVMAADEARLVQVVRSVPGYATAFAKAFPEEKGAIDARTIAAAIAAYTRKLLTPSRWDAFLAGKDDALSADEKAGLAAFLEASCSTCHAGKYVGAAQAQKLGIARPWPGEATDHGRFAVTKQDVDRDVFKVPTLRNVTRTAPYLHDGSVASLEEATRLMARHQAGKELGAEQVRAIVTFLGALAGDPPKDLVAKPDLPPSGPKTPKPD